MQVYVNGQPQALSDGFSVAALLAQLDLTGKRLAVELNGEVVPRSRHDAQLLQEGDHLEIVHAIGGG